MCSESENIPTYLRGNQSKSNNRRASIDDHLHPILRPTLGTFSASPKISPRIYEGINRRASIEEHQSKRINRTALIEEHQSNSINRRASVEEQQRIFHSILRSTLGAILASPPKVCGPYTPEILHFPMEFLTFSTPY